MGQTKEYGIRGARVCLLALALAALSGCQPNKPHGSKTLGEPAQVNGSRIVAADGEPGNWMTHGRTYSEQHFSPLKQINDGNVSGLGLAWYFDLDTHRGQEATPIVVDG